MNHIALFEWQAARMQNYMIHLMKTISNPGNDDNSAENDTETVQPKQYTFKYFNPEENLVITADHVARFYGSMICRTLTGNKAVEDI